MVYPKRRQVREGASEFTGWLNFLPNERCVKDEGSKFTS
jgi:hypothetical protein